MLFLQGVGNSEELSVGAASSRGRTVVFKELNCYFLPTKWVKNLIFP